ncbi:hypothetical protein BBO_07742 [Beauveria brongniartii RCEF 3172]|uniref:Uncharacterized protein n=1 Tax=Beauveria brongniartii RCEF 3172 TaxID=1081107 RepID=A0A166YY70_9HYPO|nr:hypothetical protein BBO_07742 [Beauveria brongniartii RCEF 3172]
MEDNPVAATFAAETAENSIAMPEFSTTNAPTTETPTAETRNTDEECSGSTDSDSDSADDDDFADDPEAVVYEHHSATGAELLARIRTALAMHPTTPFAEVRRFLEHNGSVIRHLVTMTVPHPDQYVTEPATGALHELAVRGAKEAGGGGGETLVAVAMLDWHSPLIDRHLANMVFYERERKTIRFREVMRKYRRGTHSRGAYRWLRAHNATSRSWDDEQRRAREWQRRRRRWRRLRVQHRGSWLVNEVRADGDEAMEE